MDQSPIRTLRQCIDDTIANAGDAIIARVSDHYINAEIERRANIVVSGVNSLREAEADLNKVNRADDLRYDETGAVVGSFYTKNRVAEISKAKDRIAKLETALNRVVVCGGGLAPSADDFNKLEQVIKKGVGKGDE